MFPSADLGVSPINCTNAGSGRTLGFLISPRSQSLGLLGESVQIHTGKLLPKWGLELRRTNPATHSVGEVSVPPIDSAAVVPAGGTPSPSAPSPPPPPAAQQLTQTEPAGRRLESDVERSRTTGRRTARRGVRSPPPASPLDDAICQCVSNSAGRGRRAAGTRNERFGSHQHASGERNSWQR